MCPSHFVVDKKDDEFKEKFYSWHVGNGNDLGSVSLSIKKRTQVAGSILLWHHLSSINFRI